LEEEPRLWVLSAGTGMLYGALFTLTVGRICILHCIARKCC
jgi:hypothetical protein